MKRINPYKLFVGCFLANWLLLRPEVSADAKIVYARLAQFAGKHGVAHPKQPTLAKAVGCPERNLRRYLDELKKHKLIDVVQQGLKRPNLYYFLWHPWMEGETEISQDELDELENSGMTLDRPKMATQDRPKMATPLEVLRESFKENHKDTPPTPSRGKRRTSSHPVPEEFQPRPEDIAEVESRYPTLDWRQETIRFIRYDRAKGPIWKDHHAAWLNWMTSADKRFDACRLPRSQQKPELVL